MQTEFRLLAQIIIQSLAFGRRKIRQARLAEHERQIAAPRDLHAVLQRFRQVGEQLRHFGLSLEILLCGKLFCAAFVVEHITFGDAHARLVRLEILGGKKLHRMGGDHRQPEFGGEPNRLVDVKFLVGKPGALDFEVIAVVEQASPFLRELPGLFRIARQQRAAGIAEMCAGQRDQPPGILMEPLAAQLGASAMLVLQIGAAEQTAQRR